MTARSLLRAVWWEAEALLCGAAALLLVLFLLDWLLSRPEPAAQGAAPRRADPASVLGAGAFAFLETPPAGPAPERNPFAPPEAEAPAGRPAQGRPRRAPDRPAEEPAPPAQPLPAAPRPPMPAQTRPGTTQPQPLPAPPARLATRDLRYVFRATNRSGKPVAMIELADPGRPGATRMARTVAVGDTVLGLRIQSFDDETLTLVDAGGRKHSVAFGGTRRVSVDTGTTP